MKTIGTISIAALLLASASVAYAQDSSAEKGKTGWSGGSQDQPSQTKAGETTGQNQKIEVHDAARAKDQPLTATGEDLKGKPERFAPSKTPE